MYRLPPALRARLAQPLGPVLTTEEALARARAVRILVSVGDVTTENFLIHGIVPRVMLLDGVTKRARVEPTAAARARAAAPTVVNVVNPPAEITRALYEALRDALARDTPTLIEVTGEEDLAALPALALAPDGALVAYGQPNEGVVLVTVDRASRARAVELLKAMEAN